MFPENLKTPQQLHRQRIVLPLSSTLLRAHTSRFERNFGRVRISIRMHVL